MNWTGLAAKAWDPSGGDEPQDEDFAERHSSMVFIAKKPAKGK